MTAKYIYDTMIELYNMEDEEKIMETIWNLFSFKLMSWEIRSYVEEIIEMKKRIEEEREKQKRLTEKLKRIFPKLLEIDFRIDRYLAYKRLQTSKDGQKIAEEVLKPEKFPFKRQLLTFRNLWVFAKILLGKTEVCYTNYLSKDLKQRFADFLRYVQHEIKSLDILIESFNKKFPLFGANLEEVSLSGTDFYGVDLENANLKGADLRGANFHYANLKKANLSEADLTAANFRRANLKEANMEGANLTLTNFCEACLERASFKGAFLMATSFVRANVKGANFCGVSLEKVRIKKARNWKLAVYDENQKKMLGLK